MLHEEELGSTFGNSYTQLATWNFVSWEVACGGGNTGNKDLQLAQQQCYKECLFRTHTAFLNDLTLPNPMEFPQSKHLIPRQYSELEVSS